MIKMPNPSQEPPGSFKAPNEDFKDMDVLCAFKFLIEISMVFGIPMFRILVLYLDFEDSKNINVL